MKKILFFVFILIFLNISSNDFSINFDYGLPLGYTSYELDKVYGFDFIYSFSLYKFYFPLGIEINSISTYYNQYRVNILSFPLGVGFDVFSKNDFYIRTFLTCGISYIEKRIVPHSEKGFNEFLQGELYLIKYFNEKGVSIKTGYKREKIKNGENFVHIGFGIIFNID